MHADITFTRALITLVLKVVLTRASLAANSPSARNEHDVDWRGHTLNTRTLPGQTCPLFEVCQCVWVCVGASVCVLLFRV